MYIRTSRSGGRAYLQIVEGYRDDNGKPRQRVLANLMRVDQLKPGALDPLIRGLQRAAGIAGTDPAEQAKPQFEPARDFGHLYALHQIWQQLGLGTALRRCLRSARRSFDAQALVRTMVLNRLTAPCSKLGLIAWLDTVQMPDSVTPTHQQLLRAMDSLIDNIDAVEAAVCAQVRPLLDQSVSIVFYDLTTIRYSGSVGTDDWPLVGYGRAKEGGAAKQFVLGVVQSADGLPLLHTVAPGNVGESATLQPMLKQALARFPVSQMVVIADRGLLSLDNIAELEALAAAQSRQIDFILAVPARRYSELVTTVGSLVFSGGLAESQFAGHRLVVAHDDERATAQSAARDERMAQVEAIAAGLSNKLDAQDQDEPGKGRRASDRGAYARFARELKDRRLSKLYRIDWKAELFSYERDEQAIANARLMDGKLLLLTSLPKQSFDAAAILQRYKSLADIERGFRTLKSELLIAPVHHRLEKRIRAHALICFLALLLHRVMRMRLRANGAGISPSTALATLRQIQHHDVRIGTARYQGITRKDPAAQTLCEQLEIPLPN